MAALTTELKEKDPVEGVLRTEEPPLGELKEKDIVSAVLRLSGLAATLKESGKVSGQLVEC